MDRNRTLALLLALSAVVLSGCGTAASTASRGTETFGEPPDGARWVGMNGVVVAVPDWWTTGETRCGAPVEDTVYVDNAATTDCSDPVPDAAVREVSALAVLDAEHGYGELRVRDMTPAFEVDGHQVLERAECEEWFEGVCRQMFAVPSLGVLFAVSIHDEADGDYDAIRDSLRVLPDGWVTVPLSTDASFTPSYGAEPRVADRLVEELERAGLRTDVVTPTSPWPDVTALPAELPAGSLLGTDPALGSVVADGSTITVTVAGGTD